MVINRKSAEKSKEEILREEIRSIRGHYLRILQWSIGLLITATTTLYYIRHLMLDSMIKRGAIHSAVPTLPIFLHLVGTIYLFIIATLFFFLSYSLAIKYRRYQNQLIDCCKSGIRESPISNAWWLTALFYYTFPIFDLLTRVYLSISL